MMFASKSIARHLIRGLLGFTALIGSVWWMMRGSVIAVPLAIAGFVLLRGCPTCWTIGLLETLSARSTSKACRDGTCAPDDPGPRVHPASSSVRSFDGADLGAMHEPRTDRSRSLSSGSSSFEAARRAEPSA